MRNSILFAAVIRNEHFLEILDKNHKQIFKEGQKSCRYKFNVLDHYNIKLFHKILKLCKIKYLILLNFAGSLVFSYLQIFHRNFLFNDILSNLDPHLVNLVSELEFA